MLSTHDEYFMGSVADEEVSVVSLDEKLSDCNDEELSSLVSLCSYYPLS